MKQLLLLAIVALAVPLSAAETKPLRVLLVTGGCCHDYKNQKDLLKDGIEKRINAEVTQVHTDDKTTRARFEIYDKADWAAGYDVVIHDECSADIKDTNYVQNILNAHKGGVGAVNLHCAMHSYRVGNDSWFAFAGIQSSGHGPQEPISIAFTDAKHPITAGLTNWSTIKEELYNNLRVFPTALPLAKGKQVVKSRDGKERTEEFVIAWVNQYEKGRVFSTTLGHNNATVSDPRYLDLVVRGVLWSSDKLSANGDPLRGYAK